MTCSVIEYQGNSETTVNYDATPFEVAVSYQMTVGDHMRMKRELERVGQYHIDNKTYVRLNRTH